MVDIKKLPKNVRYMDKDDLILYINKKIKLENDLLHKLDLEEIQLLLIQLIKYGRNLSASSFLMGAVLF